MQEAMGEQHYALGYCKGARAEKTAKIEDKIKQATSKNKER